MLELTTSTKFASSTVNTSAVLLIATARPASKAQIYKCYPSWDLFARRLHRLTRRFVCGLAGDNSRREGSRSPRAGGALPGGALPGGAFGDRNNRG